MKRLGELGLWYHDVDLGKDFELSFRDGMRTRPHWQQNREVRKSIDYKNKLILDLGCAEGMWAFEAEQLGARMVVAVDIPPLEYYNRSFFAREIKGSSVIFYHNVPAEDLFNRLDHFFARYSKGEKFDIVQHLGLFYHLRDPLLSLSQIRKCIKKNGLMLFETAVWQVTSDEPVCLFNWNSRIYNDGTTWWAPNLACLFAMLRLSLFEPDESSLKIIRDSNSRSIYRASLIAKAVGMETVSGQVAQVLKLDMGLDLDA